MATALAWQHPDLRDQAAQDICGFVPGAVGVQCLDEGRNLRPVDLGHGGVQRDG
ncbi:hypothetical protein [Sedimentimonas flavescens]|uniref:hypothetical protein n=1 Tax=Sedimentimonas flavescens TaxID=2851012 RepID=UPI0021A96BD5|nr:hypothetical protein [Sedimentimonas flavescens]